MPAINATSMLGQGTRTLIVTTLNGTDSLTFNTTKNPILNLTNPTGSPITPTIIGSAATTVTVPGVGNVNVAAGLSLGAIAAGASLSLPLNTISGYLSGNITITSGSGLTATLLES